jgi:small subunit ribosomal protein S9
MPVKKIIKKKKEKEIIQPVLPIEPEIDNAEEIIVSDADTKNGNGKEKYFPSVGRRKESIARVRLFTKKSTDSAGEDRALVTVNGKDYTEYFSDVNLQHIVESPLRKLKSLNRFKATVLVSGGGISGQANAVKHGLARALTLFDNNFRRKLKKSGFLTRDSRAKERRKYGLKKARKAPQWSKR